MPGTKGATGVSFLQNVCSRFSPISPTGFSLTLMRKVLLTLVFILLFPALVSCGSGEQNGYRGYLYYAKSHYLMRFSLRDGSLSVVTNLGDKTIHDVSNFLENRLLIAESASINRKEVRRISWVDVNTGQTAALYAGVLARYLEEPGFIVYDDGVSLFAVALSGESDNEAIFTHKMNQVSSMMVASSTIVLFETSEAGVSLIRSYDVITGALQSLDRLSGVCSLDQAVWINDLQQLACKQRSDQTKNTGYILTNLGGDVSGSLSLPEGKSFDALTYISDQSALILAERWESVFAGEEKSAIWVYNTQSKESQRLVENQDLGSSVVYTNF